MGLCVARRIRTDVSLNLKKMNNLKLKILERAYAQSHLTIGGLADETAQQYVQLARVKWNFG